MNQYVSDNTDDEISHETFLNAYLESRGAPPVNLDAFRTLPSSAATGVPQIGRLTNLMQLTVDTSWWTRYRSQRNPDLGATFPQAIPSLSVGQHPAIPRNDAGARRSERRDSAHPGDREHCGVSLCIHRAGRQQPLCRDGAEGNQPRGAQDHRQHRAHRDGALPDVARQGRERAGRDRRRAGLSGSRGGAFRIGRAVQEEPDHARALRVPEPLAAEMLHRSADGDGARRHERCRGFRARRPVHRSVAGVLRDLAHPRRGRPTRPGDWDRTRVGRYARPNFSSAVLDSRASLRPGTRRRVR
jgi:hypothetical protein